MFIGAGGLVRSTPEVFAVEAELRPEAIAIASQSGALSYGALEARANQVARWLLRQRGVKKGSVAAVRGEGPEFIIAILGILKAGAAYLPLDPAAPSDRVRWILEESKADLTFWQATGAAPPAGIEVMAFEQLWAEAAKESEDALEIARESKDLAYIMYTSGSTGRPKGVAITHAGVVGLVKDTNYITFENEDCVAQLSNVAFDAATFEIWGALLNGARLACLPRECLFSGESLQQELANHGVNTLFLTTSIFHQIAGQAPHIFQSLKTLVVGGEALDPRAAARTLRHCPKLRLINGYGPTEGTTFALCHDVTLEVEEIPAVPIGRPITGTEALLLNERFEPVRDGEPGEIFLGGPRLARGYWQRDDLTRERYVPHPSKPEERLYKTGDLARILPDGTWVFLGRTDQQVKVNGFRIELGEVEAALGAHEAVGQRAVLALEEDGDKRLMAFLTPAGSQRPGGAELRAYLKQSLPVYMIPSAFVWLEKLPTTANGKLDVEALAASAGAHEPWDERVSPPETMTEQALAAIWRKILRVKDVGRNDDFFELGGTSLLAVRIFSAIREQFGKVLPMGTLVQEPTLRALAARVDSAARASCLLTVKQGGPKRPLFLVHGAPGGVFIFRALAAYMGQERSIYGIEAPWLSQRPERHWSMKELAADYVREIRNVQPRGPYHLGGYSQGGSIAFAMAQQLIAEGEEVSTLLMLDAFNQHGARRLGYSERLSLNARKLEGLSFPGKLQLLAERTVGKVKGMMAVGLATLPVVKPLTTRLRRDDFATAQVELLQRESPKPYPGEITLILCEELGEGFGFEYNLTYGWEKIAKGGLRVLRTAGTHYTMFEEPHVRTLGRQVEAALEGRA